jgi:hypothetical protein
MFVGTIAFGRYLNVSAGNSVVEEQNFCRELPFDL